MALALAALWLRFDHNSGRILVGHRVSARSRLTDSAKKRQHPWFSRGFEATEESDERAVYPRMGCRAVFLGVALVESVGGMSLEV